MKNIVIAGVLFCLGHLALGAQTLVQSVNSSRSNIKNNIEVARNPNGRWICTASGVPCTAEHIKQLNASSAGQNGVKTITLARPDGTLDCTGQDGKPCSDVQFNQISQVMGMRAVSTNGIGKFTDQPAPPANIAAIGVDARGTLQCDRTPCTPDQLKNLRTMFSASKDVTIAPDGTLACSGRTRCTDAQIADLNKTLAMKTVGQGIPSVGVGLGRKSDPSK